MSSRCWLAIPPSYLKVMKCLMCSLDFGAIKGKLIKMLLICLFTGKLKFLFHMREELITFDLGFGFKICLTRQSTDTVQFPICGKDQRLQYCNEHHGACNNPEKKEEMIILPVSTFKNFEMSEVFEIFVFIIDSFIINMKG